MWSILSLDFLLLLGALASDWFVLVWMGGRLLDERYDSIDDDTSQDGANGSNQKHTNSVAGVLLDLEAIGAVLGVRLLVHDVDVLGDIASFFPDLVDLLLEIFGKDLDVGEWVVLVDLRVVEALHGVGDHVVGFVLTGGGTG